MKSDIATIPIASIEILNPRARNRKIFDELVDSIRAVGLKRPITVRRAQSGHGYELVCGQGRMEAFIKLGQTEIPAMIIEASREECFVMSLVENMARRNQSPIELVREVGVLRTRYVSQRDAAEILNLPIKHAHTIPVSCRRGGQAHQIAWSWVRRMARDRVTLAELSARTGIHGTRLEAMLERDGCRRHDRLGWMRRKALVKIAKY